jgi:hypothetical protein
MSKQTHIASAQPGDFGQFNECPEVHGAQSGTPCGVPLTLVSRLRGNHRGGKRGGCMSACSQVGDGC